ncbi:MAG: hypothetical protein Q7S72_00735 [Candidatus Taylorbacteria bacterium]|nr:hypothetical protein [Candidatus Taylorbacteria bacterium]
MSTAVLAVCLIFMMVILVSEWSSWTKFRRLVHGIIAAVLFTALCTTTAFGLNGLKKERDFITASAFEAEVVEVKIVGDRNGARVVVLTTAGNFDLRLDQVAIKGKSRLIKEAGSAKYEIR